MQFYVVFRHGHVHPCEVHYEDRVGENYFVKYSPAHKWFYYPEMRNDEVEPEPGPTPTPTCVPNPNPNAGTSRPLL